MSYRIIRTSEPSVEPVSLVEAKNHLRVDSGTDDSLISSLIIAARQLAEHRTQRCFIQSNFSLYLDAFTDEIVLPFPPLISFTQIDYYDTSGASQRILVDSIEIVAGIQPAIIMPETGTSWPAVSTRKDAIAVTYSAGYGTTAASVPVGIKQAILLLVGHWYRYREAVLTGTISKNIEFAVDALLSQYEHGYRW